MPSAAETVIAHPLSAEEVNVRRGQRFPLDVYSYVARACFDTDILHYGFFEQAGESLVSAQRRATDSVVRRLRPAPARVLEVGTGFGALLDLLCDRGYSVTGITPEPSQAEGCRRRAPQANVLLGTFEQIAVGQESFDILLFQESSQYIEPAILWSRCRQLLVTGGQVVIADEFRRQGGDEGGLHPLDDFIAQARRYGFALLEQADLGRQAAPTLEWARRAIAAARGQLQNQLGIDGAAIDQLLAGNDDLARRYASGRVTYALLDFRRA